MVKQAVRQTYTYYHPDYPEGRVVEDAPLKGRGMAWTLGAYKHPVYPSPLNVRVGDGGIKAWIVVKWLQFYDWDTEKVLSAYTSVLTQEDVKTAVWYYEQNKQAIDDKLQEEARVA